jgi:putative inorganic carbon (HCO3(-)) transporter
MQGVTGRQNHDWLSFDSGIRFFLYALIFWIPYSTAVIEICVGAALFLWILKRALSQRGSTNFFNRFRPPASILNKPIAIFIVACLLSIASTVFFEQSLRNFVTKTLEWFVVYFLVLEVFNKKHHFQIAFAVLTLTALATAVDSLVQYYWTQKDFFFGHPIEPGSRATAAFKTANGLGGYWTLVIPLFLSLVWAKWKERSGADGVCWKCCWGGVVVLAIFTGSLFVTFSRGAWLGVFLGCTSLIFFKNFPQRQIFVKGGLIFLVVLGISLMSVLLIWKTGNYPKPLDRLNTAETRLDIWRDTILMIQDRPILGHGINTFMRVFQSYRTDEFRGPTYAHNCYLQLTAETGLVGLLAFIWLLSHFLSYVFEKIRKNFYQDQNLMLVSEGILAGIFAFLIHSFLDTNWYSLQLSTFWWVMMGLQIAILEMKESKACQTVSGH